MQRFMPVEQGRLFRRLVIAGGAAVFAVEEAVGAKTDAEFGLAKHAELFARTIFLGLLALCAEHPAAGWFGGHEVSLGPIARGGYVTGVTAIAEVETLKL